MVRGASGYTLQYPPRPEPHRNVYAVMGALTRKHKRRGMGIIGWIILGLLAGLIAKALLPGDDPGGFIITALIGIAGAFIGGLIAKALGFGDPIDEFFDLSTWLGAIIGSIVLLLLYRAVVGRGGRGRRTTAY